MDLAARGKTFPLMRTIIPGAGEKLRAASNKQKQFRNIVETRRRKQTIIPALGEMARRVLTPS